MLGREEDRDTEILTEIYREKDRERHREKELRQKVREAYLEDSETKKKSKIWSLCKCYTIRSHWSVMMPCCLCGTPLSYC